MYVKDGSDKLYEENKGTNWIENHYDYASDLTNAKVIELECGHYVHNFKQDRIAEEIRKFIGK